MGQRARTAGMLVLFSLALNAYAVEGWEYRQRYPLRDATEKLVDNQGDGFNSLYGVRNFRSVLNGIYYRGGANNAYNKNGKRSNSNPLPDEGLKNLCEEGFSTAVYLYSTRYSTAPSQVNCTMASGRKNRLEYKQLSILLATPDQIEDLLRMILDHVRNPARGPIYAHCWNGWHASGLTATYALRQFCGWSAAQALAYWEVNTDGNNGTSYDHVRQKIRDFVPVTGLTLTSAEKQAICPHPSTLDFH